MGIVDGINEELQREHEDYIRLKERVEVAVGLISSGEFISKETILRSIGTESALKAAESIRKSEEKTKELDAIKYGGAVTENA